MIEFLLGVAVGFVVATLLLFVLAAWVFLRGINKRLDQAQEFVNSIFEGCE
jgi:hypothetical protein